MKILYPDISSDLTLANDLSGLLLKDGTLSELCIQDGDAAGLTVKSAVLRDGKLLKCDLSGAKIERLQLQDYHIENCDITAGAFADSSWHAVEVVNNRCSGIQLQACIMKNVLFKNCKLDVANMRFSRLENVIFEDCIVRELDLYNAQLKNVSFVGCSIEAVEFSGAKLQHVDLSASMIVSVKGVQGLKGAIISPEQLIQLGPFLAQEIGIKVEG